jgi:hypothetical protein
MKDDETYASEDKNFSNNFDYSNAEESSVFHFLHHLLYRKEMGRWAST